MSLRRGTRPGLIRDWKLRKWLPAVLAAAAGLGGTPTYILAQQPATAPVPSVNAPLLPVSAQAPKTDPKTDPKAEPKVDEKEKLLNPQFDGAEWREVFEWYAKETGLSLITTHRPTGSVIIKPPKENKYTIGGVTDLINEALLQQKFILIRRNTSFFTHPVDEKLDVPDLPLVKLTDLSKRGKTEIVQVLLPIKGLMLVEDVSPEVEKLVTRFGKVVPFPKTNTLLLQDMAGNIDRIRDTLQKVVEISEEGDSITHVCKYTKARNIAEHLKTLLKDAQTSVDTTQAMGAPGGMGFDPRFGQFGSPSGFGDRGREPGRDFDPRRSGDRSRTDAGATGRMKTVTITTEFRTNTLYVLGPPDKITLANKLINEMDKAPFPGAPQIKIEPPVQRTYTVPAGTAEVLSKILQANNPGLTINFVPNTNTIVVFATPDEHDEIRKQIFGSGTDGGGSGLDFKRFPLRFADPKEAMGRIQKFLPNGPVVEIDGDGLLLQGTSAQIDEAKKILSQLYPDEKFDDKGTGNPATGAPTGPNSRYIGVENGSAQALADLIANQASKWKNPIIVNGVERATPTGPRTNVPPRGGVPPRGVPPTGPGFNPNVPGNNPPAVRPMQPPTPLPGQPGGPQTSAPLVRGRDVRMVSFGGAPQDAPADEPKPIYIDVVGNRIRITCDDPIALQRLTEFARFVIREGEKPNDNLMEVVPLRFVSAEQAAKELTEVFNGPPQPPQQQGRGGLFGGGGNPLSALLGLGGTQAPTNPSAGRIRVVAETSSNSLIVVKASPIDLQMIKNLLGAAIDSGVNASEVAQRVHTIGVRTMPASEMAGIIRDIYRDAMGSRGGGGGGGFNPFLPFVGGGGGRQQQQAEQRPVALSVSYNDTTNTLLVRCSDTMAREIETLVDELDQTPAAASPEVVRMIKPKGDPNVILAAIDALQGRDPKIRQMENQRALSGFGGGRGGQGGLGGFGGGGLGGLGTGGLGGFGGGNRGGGFTPGGFGGGGNRGGGGGGNRGGGFAPGGGGGGGNRGGGGGGIRPGGRGGLQANSGTEGPSNFDYRGMDAPSTRSTIYDPERDGPPSYTNYNTHPVNTGVAPAGGQTIVDPMQPGFGQPVPPMPRPAPLPGSADQSVGASAPRGTITAYSLDELGVLFLRFTDPRDEAIILALIERIDEIARLAEPKIELIKLDYQDPAFVASQLNAVFARVQVGAGGQNIIPPTARTPQAGALTALAGASPTQNVYLVALPQYKALLVAGPSGRFDDILREIKKYDIPNDDTARPKAYPLKNKSAQIIAQQLQQLYRDRFSGVGPPSSMFRISFDLPSNTVYVQASRADHEDIAALIEQLDTLPNISVNEVRVFQIRFGLADELSAALIQALTANVVNPLTQSTLPWYIQSATAAGGAGGLGALLGGAGGLGGQFGGGQFGGGQLGGGQFGGGQLGQIGQRAGQVGGTGGIGGLAGFGGLGALGGLGAVTQVPTVGTASGGGVATKSTTLRFYGRDGQVSESGFLEDVHIISYARTNSIIVAAPEKTMQLIAKMIENLDTVTPVASYIKIFTLKNIDAVLTGLLLQQLFTGQQRTGLTPGAAAPGLGQAGLGATQAGQARPLLTAGGEVSPGATLIDLRIAFDDRTNSIIVAGSENDLFTIGSIIAKLEATEVPQRYNEVYKLRNAAAADVAAALTSFITNSLTVYSGAQFLSAYQSVQRNVVVVPEPVSNTIMISATPQWFSDIKRIIEKLDAQPPQVVIQVLIAEVQRTNNEEFGVEIGVQSPVLFSRSVLPGVVAGTAVDPNTGVVYQTAAQPGFNFNTTAPLGQTTLASPGGVGFQGLGNLGVGRSSSLGFGGFVFSAASNSFNLLVRALKAQGRIEILSQPSVQVADNQTGFVQVGQDFPVLTNTILTGAGASQQGIDYRQIGITMRVTPRVNPDGKVLMRVEPSIVTPVVPPINLGGGQLATAFNVQTVQTTVIAADGETVVLGGLLTKTDTRTENAIPFLKDIPYVGAMFRYRSQALVRREVLIIMTPHIMRSEYDQARILAEESAKMHWCLPDVAKMHGGYGMDVMGPASQGSRPVPTGGVPPGVLPPGQLPGGFGPGFVQPPPVPGPGFMPGPVYLDSMPGGWGPGGPHPLPTPLPTPQPIQPPAAGHQPGPGQLGVPPPQQYLPPNGGMPTTAAPTSWQAQPPVGVPSLVNPAGAMMIPPQTALYMPAQQQPQPTAMPGTMPVLPNRGYIMAPPAGGTPNGTTNPPAGQAKEGKPWNVYR